MPFVPPTIPGAQGYPLALTGATSATRYVGGTATTSPASGTFAVGDYVITQDGKVFVCTVAGSPGTWAQAGGGSGSVTSVTAANASIVVVGTATDPEIAVGKAPGYEFGYDAITSDVTVASTTEASGTTVISCAAHTFDGAAVLCELRTVVLLQSNAGASVVVSLFEGATQIARLVSTYVGNNIGLIVFPSYGAFRFTPTAASHTYTVTAFYAAAVGCQLQAGAGGTGASSPTFVRFTKV